MIDPHPAEPSAEDPVEDPAEDPVEDLAQDPAEDLADGRQRQTSAAAPGRWTPAARGRALSLAGVLVLAGLLFTTSAHEADGTSLRTDGVDTQSLVIAEQARATRAEQRVTQLTQDIGRLTASAGTGNVTGNGTLSGLQRQVASLAVPAGLTAMSGPTMVVSLDDAPPERSREGFRPDELVVHQQDIQAVMNALWAGGAEAMTLMGKRVTTTTAVRCVGNTVLVQGTLYSPPYVVVAIGDPTALTRALDTSPDVALYREYVRQVGLGWSAEEGGTQVLPAYAGSTQLRHARTVPVAP